MANHCYNTITISGDPLDVKELYDRIDIFLKETKDSYWGGTYYTMFRTMQPKYHTHSDRDIQNELNKEFSVDKEYGSKWFDIADISIESDEGMMTINGDSAWGPVLPLCEKLALDYNLQITCEYSESGMDFAGKYTYDESGCIEQHEMTYQEFSYLDDKHYFIENCIDSVACCFDSYEEFEKAYEDVFTMLKSKEDEETIEEIKLGVREAFKEKVT